MLISTIDQFKERVDVGSDFKWRRIRDYVEQAELEFLLPVLGQELIDDLDAYMQGSDDANDAYNKVIEQGQKALAITAFYLAFPTLQLKATDLGFVVQLGEGERSPYQWQVGDARDAVLMAGYAAIEKLYTILDRHKASLAQWRNSEAFTGYHDSLLRNAAEFHTFYKIGTSRITYVDLKPAIDRAQELVLRPRLGEEFYDSLIEHLREGADDSSSDSDGVDDALMSAAIKKVRRALAHFTIGEAKELSFRKANGGLLSTRFDGNSSSAVNVIDERLNSEDTVNIRAVATKKGYELLSVAQGWLDRHADSFPLYKNGPAYRPAGNDERTAEDRMPSAGGLMWV